MSASPYISNTLVIRFALRDLTMCRTHAAQARVRLDQMYALLVRLELQEAETPMTGRVDG